MHGNNGMFLSVEINGTFSSSVIRCRNTCWNKRVLLLATCTLTVTTLFVHWRWESSVWHCLLTSIFGLTLFLTSIFGVTLFLTSIFGVTLFLTSIFGVKLFINKCLRRSTVYKQVSSVWHCLLTSIFGVKLFINKYLRFSTVYKQVPSV